MAEQEWRGRFPQNPIISLLDVGRPFNLAESTSQDLTLGALLDMAGLDTMRGLKLGYGTSAGNPALRVAIAVASGVRPEEVITTQGTALGLFLLAFELCRPGDEVVLVTPCFPPSRDCLIGNGVTVVEVPTCFDQGFQLDVDRVAVALSPRTRLVSLASPQNPSGVATPTERVQALLDRMAVHAPGAYLFVDETYREAVYGDTRTPVSAAAMDTRVITGSSVSKALGAPGLRTGWLTIRDPDLLSRIATAKMNIVVSGSVLDEALAAVLLEQREQVLAPRRVLLANALAAVAQWQIAEAARLDWVRPDAGALCCFRLRPDAFDDVAVQRFWQSLPGHDLQLAAGDWFGASAREFRIGFGYLPQERFMPALAALSAAMRSAEAR